MRKPENIEADERLLAAIKALPSAECDFTRIAVRAGYDPHLNMWLVDRRLQALRRQKKIKFSHSERVWKLL